VLKIQSASLFPSLGKARSKVKQY